MLVDSAVCCKQSAFCGSNMRLNCCHCEVILLRARSLLIQRVCHTGAFFYLHGAGAQEPTVQDSTQLQVCALRSCSHSRGTGNIHKAVSMQQRLALRFIMVCLQGWHDIQVNPFPPSWAFPFRSARRCRMRRKHYIVQVCCNAYDASAYCGVLTRM